MTQKEMCRRAKGELLEIKKNDRLIRQMSQTAKQLRFGLMGTGVEPNADKVRTSPSGDQMAQIIANVIDLESEINGYISDLYRLKRDALRVISLVCDLDQRTILVARYINFKKWEEVADDMSFSVQRVYEIHGKALISYIAAKRTE